MLNSECNYVHLFILEWYILFLDWFRLMLGWWMYDMNSNWRPCDQDMYKHIKWLPLCTSLCMRVFQPLFSCFWPVCHTKNRNNNFIACECLACTQDNDIHTSWYFWPHSTKSETWHRTSLSLPWLIPWTRIILMNIFVTPKWTTMSFKSSRNQYHGRDSQKSWSMIMSKHVRLRTNDREIQLTTNERQT